MTRASTETGRGDAAATTWRFRGDGASESETGRGDAAIPDADRPSQVRRVPRAAARRLQGGPLAVCDSLGLRRDVPSRRRNLAALATPQSQIFRGDESRTPRPRRGYSVEKSRGDAAATTWIFHGDESRRRRGYSADSPWRRVAATTWIFRGRYVDAKMRLATNWAAFLRDAQAAFGFRFADGGPALVTCVDRRASMLDRVRNATAFWRGARDGGLVAATPRLPRGYSVEAGRGAAADATWIFRGDVADDDADGPRRRRGDGPSPCAGRVSSSRRRGTRCWSARSGTSSRTRAAAPSSVTWSGRSTHS